MNTPLKIISPLSISLSLCFSNSLSTHLLLLQVIKGVKEDRAGMNVTTMDLKPGFFRTSADSFEVLHCLAEHHCSGGNDTSDQCESGYRGPMCAVCVEGFASVGTGADMVCNECSGSATQTIVVGFSVIGLVLAAVIFWCCRGARGGSVEEQTLTASDSLQRQSSRARAISEAAREKADALTTFINSAQPYFKILLAYFQVAGGLSFALRLRFPPMFTNFMNIAKSLLSFDVLSLMPIGCLTSSSNFHYNMLAYTFIPFAVGMLMVIAYNILIRGRSDASKQLANKIFGAFLALSFVILPSVSIKIFSNFACHEFDGDYGSYLKMDYR